MGLLTFSIHWFSFLMPSIPRAKPVQSHEPRTPLWISHWMEVAQELGVLSASVAGMVAGR